MKALVIEDDSGIGKMVKQGLEEANYQVDWALDGTAGLRLAAESTYNVILLDLMLPKLDGWQVCRELRSQRNRTPLAAAFRTRAVVVGKNRTAISGSRA